jgi:NAD-dependent protein deacetylase/lipoamidase
MRTALGSIRVFALASARGMGQILFCESVAGGVLLLAGVVLAAPRAGVMSAVGCGVATLTARALSYPRPEWLRGLYGYAGALVGLFWAALFEPQLTGWLALVLAAMVSAPATRVAHRVLTPRDLPALALPALVPVWIALAVLQRTGDSGSSVVPQALAWAVMLAGLAVYSRLLAVAALLGGAIGVTLSTLVAPDLRAVILANSVPTAAALGGVFLPWSRAALAVAGIGAAAAGALSWAGSVPAEALGFPLLVVPFNVVTLGVLAALRMPHVRRVIPGRPAPLPLAAVGQPEAGERILSAMRRLETLVRESHTVCVLTGAGVSTAAGLPDFRGPSGLWGRTPLITLDDFVTSPAARAAYWSEEDRFFRLVCAVEPTRLHRALAMLERRGRLSAVITQNVDGLHQAAGLPDDKVIELHGNIRHAMCLDCGEAIPRASISREIMSGVGSLYCPECRGLVKGGSVMFGERLAPERLDAALRALLASDLLLVLGTSLAVNPASDIVTWAREAGIPVAIVNATPTPYDSQAVVTVTADVGSALLDVLERIGPTAMLADR